jgi:hypothetical protein
MEGLYSRATLSKNFYRLNSVFKGQVIPEIDRYDGFGYTRLYKAVWDNDIPLVTALLKGGAIPNVRSMDYILPLMAAVRGDCLEVSRLLLEYKADPQLDDFISQAGTKEMVALLGQYGGQPSKKAINRQKLSFLDSEFFGEEAKFLSQTIKNIQAGAALESLVLGPVWETIPANSSWCWTGLKILGPKLTKSIPDFARPCFRP